MSAPAKVKTWQQSFNVTITAGGSSNLTQANLLYQMKQRLVSFASNPWTVAGSSDAGGSTVSPTGSGAMDGNDRWGGASGVFPAIPGSNGRHTWIVLKQAALGTNYSICLDLPSTGTVTSINSYVSPSAGFTGGSATARPTATDEQQFTTSIPWGSGLDANHQLHIQQSTDGLATYIQMWRAGTNLATQFMAFRPTNLVGGWSNANVTQFSQAGSGIATTYANLMSAASHRARFGSTNFTCGFSCEGAGGTAFHSLTSIGDVANDFDSNWAFFPMGVYSTTSLARGHIGVVPDMYWGPIGVNDGDTFPNDVAHRDWIKVGNIIMPWTGDATAPLLT